MILDALERLLATVPMSELDVEPIAAEAGITRTRSYAYYTSKNDALAALLRRMVVVRSPRYDHPDSWFVGRSPEVRPRDALRKTIEMTTELTWQHRFVLREACDMWTAVPAVRDAWLRVIEIATTRHDTTDRIARFVASYSGPTGGHLMADPECGSASPKPIAFVSLGLAAFVVVQSLAHAATGEFYKLMDEAMERMHTGMHVAPSGDADRDFAAMMIPHHQGAIDMALLELRFGHDKRLRRLAQSIIVEQGQEIQLMRSILDGTAQERRPRPKEK